MVEPPRGRDAAPNSTGDRAVLAELEKYREEDWFLSEPPSGLITITLDLDDQVCAIEESWNPQVKADERAWLTAYGAVASVLRFSAHSPTRRARETIRGVALGQEWSTLHWHLADEVERNDVVFKVEILGSMYGTTASAYLTVEAPEGLDVETVGEPIALLREYLIDHPLSEVATASHAAYSALAELAADPVFYEGGPDERTATQVATPLTVLKDLRRRGIVRAREVR